MGEARLAAQVEIEVPFQDVDLMQVVWHGNYFRYFEAARAALLRKINYDYPEMQASRYLWPIVELKARFVQPMRYAQRIQVRAELQEWESRLKIAYRVQDAASGKRLSSGYTIQCAVDARSGELQLVSPPVLRERLKEYL
ncbi:MAG: acyl-CoA thioesterase [Gammaproteobacteria bacterium]|nr:acyl-CoA thioesterase [Gammaproteobacteria bacterium]MDE2273074.1 acyl-CoA thioesterase [Gammaproteobacteria bacterium]